MDFMLQRGLTIMRVIHMIDEFKTLCGEISEIGSFEAYRRYTLKYPKLFDKIFKGLYMTKLDNLKPMIDLVDFQKNLEIAQNNYKNGMVQNIIHYAEQVASFLGFNKEFDIYIGLELGNISGFSAPDLDGIPFVYIGLDSENELTSIKYLIPHEINHMIRLNAIKDIDMFDFMERTITEGLGVYCSIVYNNIEYSANEISRILSLPIKQVVKLINNDKFIMNKVFGEFGSKLTQDKMSEFFIWSDSDSDEKYLFSGYYVGMRIIKELVEQGYDFSKLTIMPSSVIWERYKNIVKTR